MDLQTPYKKMSKSSENKKGVISLLDSTEVIRKKIMSATTDSEMSIKYDPENKPGISNLINIYSSLKNISIEETEKEFKYANYGSFKKAVADIVVECVEDIQKKYEYYLNSTEIDDILNSGVARTREIAKEKYDLVKKRINIGR